MDLNVSVSDRIGVTEARTVRVITIIHQKISAGADDGWRGGTATFSGTDTQIRVGARNLAGSTPRDIWVRWTGLSGLSGVIISAAHIEYAPNDINPYSSVQVLTRIWAEDAASPAVPTNLTNYTSKPLTTAYVDWDFSYESLGGESSFPWDAYTPTPDISAIIQELVDKYSPTTIQILHKDRLGAVADRTISIDAYEYLSATLAPILHIEYYTESPPEDLSVLITDGTAQLDGVRIYP